VRSIRHNICALLISNAERCFLNDEVGIILQSTNPNDAKSFKDTDGDGVPDYVEQ
jgi:hypothetical protein